MWVTSPLLAGLPVIHAFSTRAGGVSEGPWAELNLGATVGDDPVAVAENRRRFRAALHLPPLAEVSQIHGAGVVRARSEDTRTLEADAVWTDRPGLAVGVRTADCAPILVAALDAVGEVRAVAAIHAGWRGVAAGVVPDCVAALAADGLAPDRMVAAVGPCIGPEAFEVGAEVVEAVEAALAGPARTRPGPAGRPLLDLSDAVVRQLERAGLRPEWIDALGLCTHTDRERFFSHRRDHGRTGRHLAAIARGAR